MVIIAPKTTQISEKFVTFNTSFLFFFYFCSCLYFPVLTSLSYDIYNLLLLYN